MPDLRKDTETLKAGIDKEPIGRDQPEPGLGDMTELRAIPGMSGEDLDPRWGVGTVIRGRLVGTELLTGDYGYCYVRYLLTEPKKFVAYSTKYLRTTKIEWLQLGQWIEVTHLDLAPNGWVKVKETRIKPLNWWKKEEAVENK